MLKRLILIAAVALCAADANAFTVRVHVLLSNKLASNLAANGGSSYRLEFSKKKLSVDPEDAAAITGNLAYWRAGAIGPDNTIGPALTDPSHGAGVLPFEQCEQLYQYATYVDENNNPIGTPEERAYALGCFFHGTTDNVAHHMVNYFTGETFTLTPRAKAMAWGFHNVIRHITFESQIEKGIEASEPELLGSENLVHAIPLALYRDVYLHRGSPVWQSLTDPILEHKGSYVTAGEGTKERVGQYLQFLGAGHAVADYPLLLPDMVNEARLAYGGVRGFFEEWIDAGASKVEDNGDDGVQGTWDDEFSCKFTCPIAWAKYFTAAYVLTPKNGVVPVDHVVARKVENLDKVVPGYIVSVQNISNLFASGNFEKGPVGSVAEAMKPLTNSVADSANITWDDLWVFLPGWLQSAIKISRTVEDAIKNTIQPVFRAISDAITKPIKEYVHKKIMEFLEPLKQEMLRDITAIKEEYKTRLAEVATEDDDWYSAFRHTVFAGDALNNAYAVLKKRTRVLQKRTISGASCTENSECAQYGKTVRCYDGLCKRDVGPRSFDAAYQIEYSAAYTCSGLQKLYFPHGVTISDMLGRVDPKTKQLVPAKSTGENPDIECFAGSKTDLTEPSVAACNWKPLPEFVEGGFKGSWSHAFPPEYTAANDKPACGLKADDPAGQGAEEFVAEGCTTGGAGLAFVGLLALALRRRRR
jgi:hypothetical protein